MTDDLPRVPAARVWAVVVDGDHGRVRRYTEGKQMTVADGGCLYVQGPDGVIAAHAPGAWWRAVIEIDDDAPNDASQRPG